MKKKIFLIATIIGYFLVLSSCNFVSKSNSVENNNNKSDSIFNVEIGYDVSINYTDSGFLRAIINAPTMIGHSSAKKPQTEMPDGLIATFYTNERIVDSKLKANYGIHYQIDKKLYVKDSVSIVNYKNETLKTDDLWWDQNKEKIYTESKVNITTPNQIIYGKGLTANQNFSKWVIKNITGVVKISPLDTTNIITQNNKN